MIKSVGKHPTISFILYCNDKYIIIYYTTIYSFIGVMSVQRCTVSVWSLTVADERLRNLTCKDPVKISHKLYTL